MSNTNDLISRQATIDTLTKLRIEKMQEGKEVSLVWECLDKLMQEPSARSEIEQKILAAGYEGKGIRIYIGGRLFAVRELAQ